MNQGRSSTFDHNHRILKGGFLYIAMDDIIRDGVSGQPKVRRIGFPNQLPAIENSMAQIDSAIIRAVNNDATIKLLIRKFDIADFRVF